ncbi:MAG: helix-turn-helix domain-containing protein [Halobacteriaceae archaeon]
MNRAEKATLQLQAVQVLRVLKRNRTYEELAAELGLPPGDLNRYVNGHVLPGIERAQAVIAEGGESLVRSELEARIRRDEEGYVDTTRAVFDPGFLSMVAGTAAGLHEFGDPDVVLTAATDGITLAAAFAEYFDARAAYAKGNRETAVDEFFEARERLASGVELTYYLPASAIGPADSVLVVDDLIRTGETQGLLVDLATEAGSDVTGVFTLVAAGTEGLERARERVDGPVAALSTIG